MYYSYRKIDSYSDLHIKSIVGARGIGKTYGLSKKIVKEYLYNNKKFIWIRDNEEALRKLYKDNGQEFFKDIRLMFPNIEFNCNSETILCNDKIMGYFMPLSTYYNYKGCPYGDVKKICFDEFIKEKAQRGDKYNAMRFINTLETIGRTRIDYDVYMLSNALDRNNDFFDIFGIKIKDYGIYTNKEKGVIVEYTKNNPEYDKAHSNSIVGKLIKNTAYENTIMNNVFNGDENLYYNKKPPKAQLFFKIANEFGECCDIWGADNLLYIEPSQSKYNAPVYVSHRTYVTTKYTVIKKDLKDILIKKQCLSQVRYKNGFSYTLFTDFLA